jgi:hypothetical protein
VKPIHSVSNTIFYTGVSHLSLIMFLVGRDGDAPKITSYNFKISRSSISGILIEFTSTYKYMYVSVIKKYNKKIQYLISV